MMIDAPRLVHLTETDLNTKLDQTPRVMDLRLAEELGFEQPRKIRDLIDRHADALRQLGPLPTTTEKPSHRGGRRGTAYWLNKQQALYLCTKSETARATEATLLMVKVFDAYTSGQKALPAPDLAPLALPLRGQSLTTADVFSPQLLAEIMERAEELALASIPRLQHELVRQVLMKLMGEQPIDIKNEHYRTSILRRFKPGSVEEDKYLFNHWAWEIVPNPRDTEGRNEIEAVIRRVVERSRKA